MKEYSFTIRDRMGLHARPASFLVSRAREFPCSITLTAAGREANAKDILSVMGLNVQYGREITVRAEGEQEDAAIAAMKQFLEENL